MNELKTMSNGENEIQVFNNPEFGNIRTLNINGEPWFVAADVCRSLELENTTRVLSRLDEDEKGVHSMNTLGGEQRMSVVSESGLYSLVLGSRKPEAKAFKRWITHDVIPSIRKHGVYMTPSKLAETLAKPENMIVILQTLQAEQMKNKELQEANQQLVQTNQLLSEEEHKWESKAVLNALVRSYAKASLNGNVQFAWNYCYKQLKYKHHIDIKLRKARHKTENVRSMPRT